MVESIPRVKVIRYKRDKSREPKYNMQQLRKEILSILMDKFSKGNHDFCFRAKTVNRKLHYEPRIIGRSLLFLSREGLVEVSANSSHVPKLWRTKFENNHAMMAIKKAK